MKTKKLLNCVAGTLLSTSVLAAVFVGNTQPAKASTTPSTKFNMSYLFYGDYLSEVAATKGSLNAVSPDYFEIANDGNLTVTSKYSKSFVDEMHQEGIEVTPYLSNNWDAAIGRAGLQNRQALAQEIAGQVQNLNLDGVDIDIEGLNESDQANLTDFVRILKSLIPDKVVSVAVAVNPYNWKTGWQGEYDYKLLAENSDYLMLMAYDESWSGESTPGPVAGLPWVDQSIQYAINQGVSPDKLVLGIPFYGRLWKTDGPTSNGTNVYGVAISQKVVNDYVSQYNGTIAYDPVEHTEKATFTIKPTDPTAVAGGITLTAGNYVIWYDDSKTITEKIELANHYNLKGTGSWTLGYEDPTTWDYFRGVLDGGPTSVSGQAGVSGQTQATNSSQTTYTVVSGDSLSLIAKNYNVTVQAIKDANGLTSDVIQIGKVLIIPAATSTSDTPVTPTPVANPTPSTTQPVVKAPAPVSKPVTKTITVTKTLAYKVVRGDSLSKLAKKYHTTVNQIKKDNKLSSDLIRVGQVLKIITTTTQTVSVPSSSQPVAAKATTLSTPAVNYVHYKVVRGDSLSLIAKKFHTTVSDLIKENHLKTTTIRVGQVLTIKK